MPGSGKSLPILLLGSWIFIELLLTDVLAITPNPSSPDETILRGTEAVISTPLSEPPWPLKGDVYLPIEVTAVVPVVKLEKSWSVCVTW